jgi:hypothetical protein
VLALLDCKFWPLIFDSVTRRRQNAPVPTETDRSQEQSQIFELALRRASQQVYFGDMLPESCAIFEQWNTEKLDEGAEIVKGILNRCARQTPSDVGRNADDSLKLFAARVTYHVC